MALFLFTKAILEGRPIDVFNHGHMRRDFTYIDDIVEGVMHVLTSSVAGHAFERPPRSGRFVGTLSHFQHRQQGSGRPLNSFGDGGRTRSRRRKRCDRFNPAMFRRPMPM